MGLDDMLITLSNNFVDRIPGLVLAIVTLIIGLIVGKIVGKIVKELLNRLKVDEYVLEGEKMTFKFSDIFPVIARWWIYLVFIQQAAMFLGVLAITEFVNTILLFLPSLIGAALIIIIGYALAEYIKDKMISKKTFYGSIVGKIVFFLLLYISVAMALEFLNVDTLLINAILLISIASLGLGIAIATGLGLKDIVATEAKKYIKTPKRRR
ncbi:MAG: hypothetical protein KJ906_00400 [Nanoarchaeota archaeon]|nr:hypothetical protein [Nanoarchaeota archaeon]